MASCVGGVLLVVLLSAVGCGGSGGTSPTPDAPDPSDMEVTEDVPTPPPGYVCASPWELPVLSAVKGPLAGGTCIPIGPRACSVNWDPESGDECQPGKLLPCKEGTAASPDGVACVPVLDDDCGSLEVPIPGGGCRRIGPVWDQSTGWEEPWFDHCPKGHIARRGGGCLQVGPRACPKLWDPETEVACEVGDTLDCADGWSESDDKLACEPLFDHCADGEIPILGQGCLMVIEHEDECPAGPYPEPPAGATAVLYVDAGSQCAADCGAVDAPFPSLQQAVDQALDGSAILVAAGQYGSQGLVIMHPVRVIGVCTEKVIITGSGPWLEVNGDLTEVAVSLGGASGVVLSNLTIAADAPGLMVDASELSVSQVEIVGSSGPAVHVFNGSSLKLERCWIHDLLPAKPGTLWHQGEGVRVDYGSTLDGTKLLVERAAGTGLYAVGSEAKLQLQDSAIRATKDEAGEGRGIGIHCTQGANGQLERVVIEDNQTVGLGVVHGSTLSASHLMVRSTVSSPMSQAGYGVEVSSGSVFSATDTVLTQNPDVGLVVLDADTHVNLERFQVLDMVPDEGKEAGMGIHVQNGPEVLLSGVAVGNPVLAGLFATGEDTDVQMRGCAVSGSRSSETFPGRGLQVAAGAHLSLADSVVEDSQGFGVSALGEGSAVQLSRSVVRSTAAINLSGVSERGLEVAWGSQATVEDCLFERNSNVGICAGGTALAPSQVVVRRCVVRDSLPLPVGDFGMGVQALDHSNVTVSRTVVEGNAAVGALSVGPGASILLDQSVVRETAPNGNGHLGHGIEVAEMGSATVMNTLVEASHEGGAIVSGTGSKLGLDRSVVRFTGVGLAAKHGHGLEASSGGLLIATESLVTGNRSAGVACFGATSQVSLFQTEVSHTLPGTESPFGIGLFARQGCTQTLTDSLVAANQDIGVVAEDPATQVQAVRSVVRDTGNGEVTMMGYGVRISQGASCSLDSCLVEDNIGTGLVVGGPDSSAEARRCIFRSMTPDNVDGIGMGLQAIEGGTLAVLGTLVEDNTGVGITATSSGTTISVLGSIVRSTRPNEAGMHGYGVLVMDQATASVHRSLLQSNATAGLSTSEKSVTKVSESAVMATDAGGAILDIEAGRDKQVFGDGLLAEDAQLFLDSVVSAANDRCGVYYYNSSGSMTNCLIMDNSSYGLALDNKGGQQVDHENRGNVVSGNAGSLPPAQSADTTTSPAGLPLPKH